MKRLLSIPLALGLLAAAAFADEATVQYRLTGLFQPDRVDDLHKQADVLTSGEKDQPVTFRLVEVNYDSATVTFAYDPAAKPLKNAKPDQLRERINNLLRQASKGAFQIFPLSTTTPAQQHEERLSIAGLDCKGCAYGAYRTVAQIDGVERATVSFKEGRLTAWIDPAKTNRDALAAALRKARIDVTDPPPPPTPEKPAKQ